MAATLALAVMIPLGTMAASYDSTHTYRTANGQQYEIWSTIYQDSDTVYRGASWAHTANSVEVPAESIGVGTGLYSSTGKIYAELEESYNSTPATFHYRSTGRAILDDKNIYAQGKIKLFDSTLSTLAVTTLESDGSYPTTASGETYGSELLANQVGEIPDLISAIGVNGIEGYVRANELYPEINTREEAREHMEWMLQNTAGYREIPVYDLNGSIVDQFHVTTTVDEVSDEIQSTINSLEQQDAQRNEEPPAHLAAQISKDFAGYPVNSKGETYGDQTMFSASGIEPDLRAAIGTNGEHGYIRTSDTIRGKFTINSREDAKKYMDYLLTQPDSYLIPLYDKEGNVIGQFRYGGSGASDPIWKMRQAAQ